ncbi:MAG: alpha/beta hydrolase [Bacteroidia bacterium]|nr:alpha/beta hydrolase [Bacteroidia bacterium]MDW8159003.1 alpha/beta hydrolase [Bacteroidia bacterium]
MKIHVWILALILFHNACELEPRSRFFNQPATNNKSKKKQGFILNDTTLLIGRHVVEIRVPQNRLNKNLLILPGWNFARDDWCQKSKLCSLALAKGYTLILPEMGKSIYAFQTYPQTRKDWLHYPTGRWVVDTMIPFLQKRFRLLLPKDSNFLIGLSTGARGVALLAEWKSDLWKAGAALSGDYQPLLMPSDKLLIGFYGPLAQFPQRWKGKDNPTENVRFLRAPLYLGHGTQDLVVPVEQTRVFFQAIQKHNPTLARRCKLNLVAAKHDYAYWNSELDAIFDFFEEQVE